MDWLQPAAAALLGSWAGLMAQSGWGNYHDGVRPLLAEFNEGNLSRAELVSLADEANRPFISGTLGLSALAGVPLAHWLWLPAEALGYRSRGRAQALLGGALWGVLAWAAVAGIRFGAGELPVPLIEGWERAATVVLLAVLFTPALAAGHRFGLWPGAAALLVASAGAGVGLWAGGPMDQPGPALVGGVVGGLMAFAAFATWDIRRADGPRAELPAIGRRVPAWAMLVQAAILALAVRAGTFGWSTADGVALSREWWGAGAAVVAVLMPAFTPQWSAALISTGVMQIAGLGTAILAGFLAPSLVWAPVLGVLGGVLELRLLPAAARFPELREAGESLRWAFGKAGQAGVLAGAVWGAAELLPGGLGPAAVIGFTFLNDLLPRPVWSTAAPAWGLLLTGLIANLFRVLGGL